MPAISEHHFSAIAYDFDGTLCASIDAHTLARKEAFRRIGEELGDERYLAVTDEMHSEAHRHGSNPPAIIGWILAQAGIAGADYARDPKTLQVVELKKTIYEEAIAQGGQAVEGAVSFVRKSAVLVPGRLEVVTTASRKELMPFLARYKLDRYFSDERIITKESVGAEKLKPDPAAYELALQRIGLESTPRELLVIEDSPHGIEAAKRAGNLVVGIATTHSLEDLLAQEGDRKADIFAADFAELDTLISRSS